jgi:hypothetical protein
MSPSGMQGTITKNFHNIAIQFLEASIAAWPSDTLLPLALTRVKAMNPDEAIALFDTAVGPFESKLTQKDPNGLYEFGSLDALVALQIREKYDGANANTRDTIWTYVGHLCRFVSMWRLYKHVPTQILGAVGEAAATLKHQLDSGSVDPSKVNPFELGQQVMSKFKPEELDSMMKDLMGNPNAINAMMSQMTSLLGSSGNNAALSGLASVLGGGTNGAAPDIQSLATSLMNNPQALGNGLDLSSLMNLLNKPK